MMTGVEIFPHNKGKVKDFSGNLHETSSIRRLLEFIKGNMLTYC